MSNETYAWREMHSAPKGATPENPCKEHWILKKRNAAMSRCIDVFDIDPADIAKMSGFQTDQIERLNEMWRFKHLSPSQFSAGVIVVFETDLAILTIATNGVVQSTEKPVWTIGV